MIPMTNQLKELAFYLIELPLLEHRLLKYSPYISAASALYLAFKMLKNATTEAL